MLGTPVCQVLFPSRTASAGESKRGATAGRNSRVASFDQPSREPSRESGREHLFVSAGRTCTRRGYSAGYANHPDQASYVPDFYQESPNGRGRWVLYHRPAGWLSEYDGEGGFQTRCETRPCTVAHAWPQRADTWVRTNGLAVAVGGPDVSGPTGRPCSSAVTSSGASSGRK